MITLADVAVYSNCQPIVDPDPIIAFWTTQVSGASGPTAVLEDAKLEIVGSVTEMQTLTVDVPTVALSGGAGTQDQRKTLADSVPTEACGALCGGEATYRLELTFLVDGASIVVVDSGDFGCVY